MKLGIRGCLLTIVSYIFISFVSIKLRNRDSSVIERWATSWMIGGSSPGRGWVIFLSTTASRPALGPTPPPIQWVLAAPSLDVKRPGREADHSPPSSVEVNNAWSYTPTPTISLMAWCSVKASYLFRVTLTFWRAETIGRRSQSSKNFSSTRKLTGNCVSLANATYFIVWKLISTTRMKAMFIPVLRSESPSFMALTNVRGWRYSKAS
jgi:hypothetical protein